jgi:hypothetical protein
MIKPINIFISYRRKDSSGNSRSIYLALKNDFEIFYDTDSIPYGKEFPKYIEEGIQRADIFLSIIGQESAVEFLKRKEMDDFVLKEILYAKELNKYILPIFIDGAFMPNKDTLPSEIVFLTDINGFELNHIKFNDDIEFLKKNIRKIVYPSSPKLVIKSSAIVFQELETFLKNSKWEEANLETINLFLNISKREKFGWLKANDINSLSCDFIFEVNRLWSNYSGGYFCFSKQLELIENNGLSVESTFDYQKFSEIVLWQRDKKWLHKGDEKIVGSFPLPISLKDKLSVNRDSFQNLLKKFRKCQELYQ